MNLHIKKKLSIYALFVCSIIGAKGFSFDITQKNDSIGGILLTKTEIKKLFPDETLKQIGIQYPIFKVYSFEDKKGKQYLIFTENITRKNIQNEKNDLTKSIKAFNVQFSGSKKIKTIWTMTDFIDESEKSIWFWTRYLSLKDLDNDGYIEPILVYGTKSIYGENFEEGRVKILIYHLGEKIAIRHQNSEIDDGRHTQIDEKFHNLPFEIKKKVNEIIISLEKNEHSLFNTEIKNELKNSLKN